MALNKVIYVDGQTVITAENLNDIQDAIIALENAPAQGLTEDMKQALLQIARKVAYIDDQGQTYYDDLYDALYPAKTLIGITAVFSQGSAVIYNTASLESLKPMLTVTGNYDDGSSEVIPSAAYTLSGTLTPGTSTIVASYNGKTASFNVTVTEAPTLLSIIAVYTQSGTVYTTDTLDSLKSDLVVTAHYSDSSTQTVPAADYTLSGTLTTGTSTITVSYSGKTTTFSVTVSEAPLLPTEYQQVEYIKATGTQHIITDLNVDSHDGTGSNSVRLYTIDIDFQFDEWQSSYATNIMAGFGATAGLWIGYANSVTNIAMGTSSGNYFSGDPTERHQYHWKSENGYGVWTREDSASISRAFAASATGERDFDLFYLKVAGGTQNNFHFNGKLYSCKVFKSGVAVLDLYPCYRKSDGVIGLYDTVNSRFYTNNGSGTFEKGADVA